MTIESNGQAYTFEGYLTSTEINMDYDELDVSPYGEFRHFRPETRRTNITLEIVATGPLTRTVLPQKGKRNVQR